LMSLQHLVTPGKRITPSILLVRYREFHLPVEVGRRIN
jgi:hypothetical protein